MMNGNGNIGIEDNVPKRRVLGKSSTTTNGRPSGNNVKQRISALEASQIGGESSTPSISSSFDDNESVSGQAPVSDFFCPICHEKMITLPQLNRHLDDSHGSDEPVVKHLDEDIKTWFKKKVMNRANDVITGGSSGPPDRKSLVKLDLFDNDKNFSFSSPNDSSTNLNEQSQSQSPQHQQQRLSPVRQREIPKTHWKKAGNDYCHQQGCNRYLNIKNGIVNCRKCGNLFCNEHTFFKMKINEDLEYDPDGVMVRCCQSCFKGKPGYDDCGFVRDLNSAFQAKRGAKVTETALEVNRLERRLIKFYEYFSSLEQGQRPAMGLKQFEKTSVVNWEIDSERNDCFVCHTNFSSFNLLLRKHHCRLCGRIVCGDVERQCSLEVPVNVLMQYLTIGTQSEMKYRYPPLVQTDTSIRCCIDCKKKMFDKKLFANDLQSAKPEILRIYDTIMIYRNKIESIIPVFKKDVNILNDTDIGIGIGAANDSGANVSTTQKLVSDHNTIQSISKERVKLQELFKKLDQMTKKLNKKVNKDEKEQLISFDELRLEKSIYSVSVSFLQENMSKLQEISSEHSINQQMKQQQQEKQQQEQANNPKITRKEVRINREKLMVLKEQKFLVEEMIMNNKKRRKFEDLKSLEMNLKDIEYEIEAIDQTLGDEFAFE